MTCCSTPCSVKIGVRLKPEKLGRVASLSPDLLRRLQAVHEVRRHALGRLLGLAFGQGLQAAQ